MTSSPKLRIYGPNAKNESNNPWHFTDTPGKQTPCAAHNTQHKDSLLNSYLGRGARLASFDSYNNSPDDDDSLFESTFLPSDTRCPLIAEDKDENLDTPLHSARQDPAVLNIAPATQLLSHSSHPLTPKPFHQNSLPEEDTYTMSNPPQIQYVDPEVYLSPSTSLEHQPVSPINGYPNDDRVNTMSTECSTPRHPPAYTARESSSSPDTMTPFLRLRSAAIGVHAAVKLTRMQRFQKKAKWASKKFLVFTLSKVGLVCVVVAYVILGAFLFQHLEGGDDQETVEHQATMQQRQVAEPFASGNKSRTIIHIPDTDKLNLLREKYVNKMWDTTFSLNVLSKAVWQANITNHLLEFEDELFKLQQQLLEQQTTNPTVTGIENKQDNEKEDTWTYARSLLFCVAVITTIGYGDTVPSTNGGKVACIFYGLIGIPIMLLCLANIGHFLATCFRFLWQQAQTLCLVKDNAADKRTGFRNCKVRVPISVILLTLFLYLMLGASLFSGWEGWAFLDGCYFVFVTLSTIGFGDLVPGNATKPANSHAQRVACALYLLFGLSLVSMIFQLMQEWVRHIMARYAQFLGLTKEQIKKDKEVVETGIIDVSMEDEVNKRKLLEDLSVGTGAAAGTGCSDVVAAGVCHENKQTEAEGQNDPEYVGVTGLDDGVNRQDSLGHQLPSKTSLQSDAKQDDSSAEQDSQRPPSVEEASNALLGLFRKRQAQAKSGKQSTSSGSLSRDSVGDSEPVLPTPV